MTLSKAGRCWPPLVHARGDSAPQVARQWECQVFPGPVARLRDPSDSNFLVFSGVKCEPDLGIQQTMGEPLPCHFQKQWPLLLSCWGTPWTPLPGASCAQVPLLGDRELPPNPPWAQDLFLGGFLFPHHQGKFQLSAPLSSVQRRPSQICPG